MLTQRSRVDLPAARGPDDDHDVPLVHRQVHALQDVEVPEPLVDPLRAGSAAAPSARSVDAVAWRLRHPPAPAIPTSPLRRRFSAAFTSRIRGSVTTRYAIAATVKNVALNVAD